MLAQIGGLGTEGGYKSSSWTSKTASGGLEVSDDKVGADGVGF